MGSHHFAGVEVGLVLQREAGEFLKFLGGQEFIKNHTSRRQNWWHFEDRCGHFGNDRGSNMTWRLRIFRCRMHGLVWLLLWRLNARRLRTFRRWSWWTRFCHHGAHRLAWR